MSTQIGRTIISLGGSLFIPDGIDTGFLKSFKALIEERVNAGERFVIIVGGGKLCRRYQAAGAELAPLTQVDTDWIGIHVTRLNAEFMRIIFGDLAHEQVCINPHEFIDTEKPVIFGAGGEPGWSTDYDAIVCAHTFHAKRVLNLSNTNYVYDKDPKHNPDAQPIKSMSWTDYRALIPTDWSPGLNTPFDPIASREAQQNGVEVDIINGTRLEEVAKCLRGEEFDGSVLHA